MSQKKLPDGLIMPLISDASVTVYTVLNKTYQGSCQEAVTFTKGLLAATQDAASLAFTNIAISRTTVWDLTTGQSGHGIALVQLIGPLTPEQFLQVMQYDQESSLADWSHRISAIGNTATQSAAI
jgi:hypothetical protein